jgi:hypothetical protein
MKIELIGTNLTTPVPATVARVSNGAVAVNPGQVRPLVMAVYGSLPDFWICAWFSGFWGRSVLKDYVIFEGMWPQLTTLVQIPMNKVPVGCGNYKAFIRFLNSCQRAACRVENEPVTLELHLVLDTWKKRTSCLRWIYTNEIVVSCGQCDYKALGIASQVEKLSSDLATYLSLDLSPVTWLLPTEYWIHRHYAQWGSW